MLGRSSPLLKEGASKEELLVKIYPLGEIGNHDRLKICSLWVAGSSPAAGTATDGKSIKGEKRLFGLTKDEILSSATGTGLDLFFATRKLKHFKREQSKNGAFVQFP